jgi:signal transduction histidine kinase
VETSNTYRGPQDSAGVPPPSSGLVGAGPRPAIGVLPSLPIAGERFSESSAAASTRHSRLAPIALASIAAAGVVAYSAAVNPHAAPAGPAGSLVRAAYVLAPAAVGIYAWDRHPEERLGRLLIVLAVFEAFWALNGSENPALFGVARLVGIAVAPLISYVVLSFPEGRLHSRRELWVVAGSGAVIAVCWVPLVFITAQPAILTPLVRCAPHCPRNLFLVGAVPGLDRAMRFGVRFGYAVMLVGVIVLLFARLRSATAPMRRMLAPVLVASILYAGGLALYLAAQSRGASAIAISGWLVIVAIPAIPLALLLGLRGERTFVRLALARLVTALPGLTDTEQVQVAMATAFKDDSLQILSWRAADGRYVDRDGTPVKLPNGRASMATTKLQSEGEPLCAIVYDSALAEDARFIRAIAGAAMLSVEKAQLQSDLRGSQRRLVRTADLAREQIERDLHDGAQQQLVAVRIRLGLAAAAIDAGSADAAAMVRRIGSDVDAALEELRQLGQGMSPPLLARGGLGRALSAAALRSTQPTTVKATGIARYHLEVEAAVYFCCVEALQNAAKHAGPDATITVVLSDDRGTLRFEVADTGLGFDQRDDRNGSGLTHMRDRIGAVGGTITISSTASHGTTVSGTIPNHRP